MLIVSDRYRVAYNATIPIFLDIRAINNLILLFVIIITVLAFVLEDLSAWN